MTGARRSLATRLALVTLITTAVIFFSAAGAMYFKFRVILLEAAETQSAEVASATANRIAASLNELSGLAHASAYAMASRQLPPGSDELEDFLLAVSSSSANIRGIGVSYEPYQALPDQRYFGISAIQTANGPVIMPHHDDPNMDSYTRDWYQVPALTGKPFWTNPSASLFDANRLITTFSVPINSAAGEFIGVTVVDTELSTLTDLVAEIELYNTGFAFLTSSNGQFVSHPNENWIMRESLFSLAETLNQPELRQLGRDMQRLRSGFRPLPPGLLDVPAYIHFVRLPSVDWAVGVIIPEHELFADIHSVLRWVATIGAVGFLVLLLTTIAISRGITRPLLSLVSSAGEIARGNLDQALPPPRINDEVGELTQSLDEMRRSLKDYINDLTATTAAKERIESELKIARNIQMSFLPKRLDLGQAEGLVDLRAKLISAKAVGGDLYDYFIMQSGRHLYFAVGDVSDKGVPAALFMAVTKTLVKGFAETADQPNEILRRVNDELAINNESGMFVSYLGGILDLDSGQLQLANAGHTPSLIRRANGEIDWLKLPPDLVLGVMDGFEFQLNTMQLAPGDTLMLYTDGVTEAADVGQRFYGEDRLLALFSSICTESANEQVKTVVDDVLAFTGEAEQADDITVLVLRYRP